MRAKILSFSIFLFLLLVTFLSTHSGEVFIKNSIDSKINTQLSISLIKNQKPDISILKNHILSNDDDIISLENDDDDFVFTGKHFLPTRYLTAIFANDFILFATPAKIKLPVCNHFSESSSPKYLVQQVFRI
ncbi:MAG: hypothetical protein ABIP95_03500 [Pelobium sp.]